MGTAMDQGDGDIAFGRRECIPTQLCANFPNASSSRIPLEETNSVTLRLFGYPFLLIQPSRHANMPLLQIMGRRHGITWTWGIILLLHECSNFMLFFLKFSQIFHRDRRHLQALHPIKILFNLIEVAAVLSEFSLYSARTLELFSSIRWLLPNHDALE